MPARPSEADRLAGSADTSALQDVLKALETRAQELHLLRAVRTACVPMLNS